MKLRWMSFPLLLFAAVPAYSQAKWVHPLPRGHTLYDIVFLDNNTAIAVGECGTILVTLAEDGSAEVAAKGEL